MVLFATAILPAVARAQCSGPGGVPFNCANAGAMGAGDYLMGGQSGNTVKFTAAQIATFITGGGSVAGLGGNNVFTGTNLFTGALPSLTNPSLGIGSSATLGGILSGQGSTNDLTFQNKAGTTVLSLVTGTGNWAMPAGSLKITGRYQAYSGQGAFGSDATDGAIVLGKGSTNDVCLRNQANLDALCVVANTHTVTGFRGANPPIVDTFQALALGFNSNSQGVFNGSTTLAVQWNPAFTTTATGSAITIGSQMSGGLTGGGLLNNLTSDINADNVDASAIGGLSNGYFGDVISGSNANGNRNGIATYIEVTSTPASGASNDWFYTAIAGQSASFAPSPAAGQIGLFGALLASRLHTGATGTGWGQTGLELDITSETGTTPLNKVGIQIVREVADAVQGANEDTAFLIANQIGAGTGWKKGISFTTTHGGQWAIDPGGELISIGPGIAAASTYGSPPFQTAYGLRLSDAYYTNYSFAFPGLGLTGAGTLDVGCATVVGTSGTLTIGGSNWCQTATAPTVVSSGSGTGIANSAHVSDIYSDRGDTNNLLSGVYQVATTLVRSASITNGGTGGTTSGSCTMVGTTGTGTLVTLTGAVSAGAFSLTSVSGPGSYSVDPTSIATEPLADGTCVGVTGAIASLSMGVATFATLSNSVWSASCSGTQTMNRLNGMGGGVTAALACTQNTTTKIATAAAFTGAVATLSNGTASIGASSTNGGLVTGQGSVNDLTFQNSAGTAALSLATGTTNWTMPGSFQLNGTQQIHVNSGPATTMTPALFATGNLSGTVNSGVAIYDQVGVGSDVINTTSGSGPGGLNYYYVGANFGGPAMTGNRTGITAFLNQTGRSGNGDWIKLFLYRYRRNRSIQC